MMTCRASPGGAGSSAEVRYCCIFASLAALGAPLAMEVRETGRANGTAGSLYWPKRQDGHQRRRATSPVRKCMHQTHRCEHCPAPASIVEESAKATRNNTFVSPTAVKYT